MKSRTPEGWIDSGTTYRVAIPEDGFVDQLTGGNGADSFHPADDGDVTDASPADSFGQQPIAGEDLI